MRKSFSCLFDELNGELISYAHIDCISMPEASIRIEIHKCTPSGEENEAKSIMYRRNLFKRFVPFPS